MGAEAIRAARESDSEEDVYVPCDEGTIDIHDLEVTEGRRVVEAEDVAEGSDASGAAFVPFEVTTPDLQVSDSCSSCAICLDPIIERRCFHGVLGQPAILRATSDSTVEPGYCETPCGHTFHAKCLTELFEHLAEVGTPACPCCRTAVPHQVMLHAQLVLSEAAAAADTSVTVSPEVVLPAATQEEVVDISMMSSFRNRYCGQQGSFILWVFGACGFVATTAFVVGVALNVH